MFLMLGTPKDLNSLRGLNNRSPGKIRREVPILAIDDSGFHYEDLLRKADFNIRALNDIHDINAVSEYSIVICDIRGVGSSFGSKYEGAHVLKEIRNHYPNKIIIAYTAGQFDPKHNEYLKECDDVFAKDLAIDDWISRLDNYVNQVVDPIQQWRRVHKHLWERGVPTVTILRLEQRYIKGVLNGDQKSFENSKDVKSLGKDIKPVIENLAKSAVFKLAQLATTG